MPKSANKDLLTPEFILNLTELVPGMIALYNLHTGEYKYVNRAVKKILGYSPEEFINGGLEFVSTLVHPDDMAMIVEKNQAALNTANQARSKHSDRDPIVNFEYRMKHKDGNWIWLHTDGIVYDRTDDGKVNHVMNISLDITHRKSSEDYLKHMAEELKVLNRTKDDFITIASHQLRTPATAIKQYLGLLLGGYSDPLTPDQKDFIQKAYESNQRQLDIVEDILRTAQLDADKLRLKFGIHDIGAVVGEAIENINSQFQKKQQQLVFSKPGKPVEAALDKGQILMVFENLLENASHYTEKGKKISVKIKKIGGKAHICIADEGVGIKKADLEKLFQKFSRITNPLSIEAGGSGLGLYWAEKIVKMHRGEIKVSSVLHQGTEFTVILPAS